MKEDQELVARVLANGPEGFRAVVEKYQHAVFGVALSRLRDFHEAEDVAQQVFVEAFQRLGRLRDPARLGAWLRSITVHRCVDVLRRRKNDLPFEDARDVPSSGYSPDEHAERRELRDRVMEVIASLPRKQRETVTLFYINGYSVQDIADMQEAPVGSIKRRLHDPRERLKEEMLEMVESTLRTEAPKDDFADRVFNLLSREHLETHEPGLDEWPSIIAELRDIGVKGVGGLVRALGSADWKTRHTAAMMIGKAGVAPEPAVALLKECVFDTNQYVRAAAARALMLVDVSPERKREEFLPLVLPLLEDATRRVRMSVAGTLWEEGWAADVPLETAARALAKETDGRVRRELQALVLAILEAGEEKDQS